MRIILLTNLNKCIIRIGIIFHHLTFIEVLLIIQIIIHSNVFWELNCRHKFLELFLFNLLSYDIWILVAAWSSGTLAFTSLWFQISARNNFYIMICIINCSYEILSIFQVKIAFFYNNMLLVIFNRYTEDKLTFIE